MFNENIFSTNIISISPKIIQFIYINSCQSIAYYLKLPRPYFNLIFKGLFYLLRKIIHLSIFFINKLSIFQSFILGFGNFANYQRLNSIFCTLKPFYVMFIRFSF